MHLCYPLQKIMAAKVPNKESWKNRVFLNPLPREFLRITDSAQKLQEDADRQTALALQQHFQNSAAVQHAAYQNIAGRLSITIAQAKLAKNYGMTRMDPYARIRVGHCVYETHTDANGGKNPRWNKVVQCLLPQGVNTITLEIYDERSFTMDELIAWTQIKIPQQVIVGETHEDWYPLTGKQGDGVEGMVNLVLSYLPTPGIMPQIYPGYKPPVVLVPNVGRGCTPTPMSVQQVLGPQQQPPVSEDVQGQQQPIHEVEEPQPPVAQPVPILSESELSQIEEMFPNVDKEVIKSVFEANRGNKDTTINSLLQLCE